MGKSEYAFKKETDYKKGNDKPKLPFISYVVSEEEKTKNKAFSDFTGYAPGEKCSRRDLILDLAGALNAKGVKLICFSDQELIDWINTCNRQGGVCTLDWPFNPTTGLLKDFGLVQLKRVAQAVKNE